MGNAELRCGGRFVLVTADVDAVRRRLRAEALSPRQDFDLLARALGAETLSFSDIRKSTPFTRMLGGLFGPSAALAWLAFWRRGAFYFVTAENTALPLALLLTVRPRVVLACIGHRVTTPLKRFLMRRLRLARRFAVLFCYSRRQEHSARDEFGLSGARAQRIAFQVDELFFSPADPPCAGHGVVSVGRELRDYPTLFKALEGTGIPVTVVASSPWSKRRDRTADCRVPANVTLRQGISSEALRDLYRQAAVVVVPLMNVDWPAGVTSLFEAQACGRPVVVSASDGIQDSFDPGAALTVPCGDARALREAVLHLLDDPAAAGALGRAGYASVVRERTLDQFVARITAACEAACGGARRHTGDAA